MLENFAKFAGKNLCQSLCQSLLSLKLATSLKRDSGIYLRGRSIHWMCSVKKDFLRNFAKFTGKHMCQGLFFNKVTSMRHATLLRKRLWNRCFSVKFTKFLRTPFLQNTSRRLLLVSGASSSINHSEHNKHFFIVCLL